MGIPLGVFGLIEPVDPLEPGQPSPQMSPVSAGYPTPLELTGAVVRVLERQLATSRRACGPVSARQNEHPSGKPAGLSLPDLPAPAEPAAHLTE